ncbi:peptidylprolyl isomerase [Paenibacillus sp. FSL R5-0475]|uniref:peptidylprolyl isomerase n=1 Tax=Paenibacillus odorifer TaxID=189426 RepID=A0ABX3HAF6_9BACL|nr:peptidylprolyl isomerase [Paenibacillus odorifer]OMD45969.1 hypothetical protein BSK51_27875 [Paenibacillus odorifer]
MKTFIILVTVIVALLSLFLIAPSSNNDVEDIQTVATMNGEPIQIPEFMLILNNNYVAKTYNYFSNNYGVKNYKDFWTTVYGNEKPIDYAKNLALKELIRIKSEQILMKEYGVANDISYGSFLNELEQENKRRKIAVDNNQVIYGPIEYSEYQYFSHVFANHVVELKKKLEKETFNINESDLRALYENVKEEYFMDSYQIKVEKISMKKSKNADKVMKNLLTSLQNGYSFKQLSNANQEILFETQTFNETTSKTDYDVNPQLLNEAKKISVGEISNIIEENNTLTIIRCIENKDRGFQEYDKVKEQVKTQIIDEKYEELIHNKIEHADVEISDVVFNNLIVEQ